MRIGGSGTITANVDPSGGGVMRGNDLVAERDGVFISPFLSIVPVLAEYSCIQLLNVAASGRRLLIDGFLAEGSTSVQYQVRSHNVALAADGGAWISVNPDVAAGNAHVFSDTLGVLPGTLMYVWSKETVRYVKDLLLAFPIMLDEGEGLVFTTGNTNRELRCQFLGREV